MTIREQWEAEQVANAHYQKTMKVAREKYMQILNEARSDYQEILELANVRLERDLKRIRS